MIPHLMGGVALYYILMTGPLPQAEEILSRVDENSQGTRIFIEMRQVITRPTGEKRILVARRYRESGGEKQVIEFTSPESIRGVRVFLLEGGEDIRIFSPERKEVVALQPQDRKNALMGSDLRYEDLYAPIASRFIGRTLNIDDLEGVPCYVLSLRPGYPHSGYTRVLMWIDVMACTVRQVDYYQNNESTPFKRLIYEDFRLMSGRQFPWRWYIVDLVKGGKTLCEIVDVQFPETFDESLFDPQNLVKDDTGGN